MGKPVAWSVRLEPSGLVFDAPADAPIWRSARAAGIRLPSSCRNGTCRRCIGRLREGAVVYRIAWPGLSREEKADGFVLPCVAHPVSDLVLEAPHAVS